MPKITNKSQKIIHHKRYTRISYKKRLNLISKVQNEGISIKRASVELKIKYETAKMILKNYRDQGHIFQRKKQIPVKAETAKIQIQEIEQFFMPMIFQPFVPWVLFVYNPSFIQSDQGIWI